MGKSMDGQLVFRLEPIVLWQPLRAYAAVIDVNARLIGKSRTKYLFSLKGSVEQVSVIQLRQLMPAQSVCAVERHVLPTSVYNTVNVTYDVELLEAHIDETIFWLGSPCVFGCFLSERGLMWGYVLSVDSELETHRYLRTVYEECETYPVLLDLRSAGNLGEARERFEKLLESLNKLEV